MKTAGSVRSNSVVLVRTGPLRGLIARIIRNPTDLTGVLMRSIDGRCCEWVPKSTGVEVLWLP
jgi:hypothetical protein